MALGHYFVAGGVCAGLDCVGNVLGPANGGVTLIIHSKIDRPILGFSVNGMAGGMPALLIPVINMRGKMVKQPAVAVSAERPLK